MLHVHRCAPPHPRHRGAPAGSEACEPPIHLEEAHADLTAAATIQAVTKELAKARGDDALRIFHLLNFLLDQLMEAPVGPLQNRLYAKQGKATLKIRKESLPFRRSQAVLAAEPSPVPPSPLASQPAAPAQVQSGQDWPAVVADLKLGGMARMLADQCELKSFGGSTMCLGLAEANKHLLDKIYQEKLEAALRQKFGASMKVRFEIGAVSGHSPVEVRARAKAERQAEAVAAIESDPFIRDLVEQFDARIDPESFQPIGGSQ